MKRMPIILLLIILMALTAVSSARPAALAQTGGDCVELLINGALEYQSPGCVAPTDTPPATNTAVPTETPTITPTATISPTIHDVTTWHPPGEFHLHGFDITASSFYTLVMTYTGQEIGYQWLSSPAENGYPYPGKHEGFVWLIEEDTGCQVYSVPAEDVPNLNCIDGYALLVHTMGTADAERTRVHSFGLAARVCGPGGVEPCGWIYTGGHTDYGVLHHPYKGDICRLPSDPANYPYSDPAINPFGPPYRTGHGVRYSTYLEAETNTQLWQSFGPGSGLANFYPHDPNHIAQLAWAFLDGWSTVGGDVIECADPAFDVAPCPDGSCNLNHTLAKTQGIFLYNLPGFGVNNGRIPGQDFLAYTDVGGHVDPDCTAPSATCVPLFISANVPEGVAGFNRPFRSNRCDLPYGPCFEFDDGTLLLMPGYEED